MGHRKYSAPRRGSMAFYPRSRAGNFESRIRTWPDIHQDKPHLLGFAGFKVGALTVMTVDDREKTPNFGKNLLNPSTLIVTPPIKIIGIRGYKETLTGKRVVFDFFAEETDKNLKRRAPFKNKKINLESVESFNGKLSDVKALISISPVSISLPQKKPFVWEIPISAKDNLTKIQFAKENLGKEITIKDVFQTGQFIDVSAITRGKGVEGPITRFGVKRKQHKSRKSVRAVGTLGPISPAVVMYTVPRQGQHGFHQRTEYNKRVLLIASDQKDNSINPPGGFDHFGHVDGDYIIVRGSVPGVPKRLIKMRMPIRKPRKKIIEPKIVEVISRN
jgi:large subunit ribosomal protein L3